MTNANKFSDAFLRVWEPACQAIALLLAPHAEVVLRDLGSGRILGIWNPITSHDRAHLVPPCRLENFLSMGNDVYGPRLELSADGRRLSSVSTILRASRNGPAAVLCINLDRTPLEQAVAVLSTIGAPTPRRQVSSFEPDWSGRIQCTVSSYVRETGRSVERMTRKDRLAVVGRLDEDQVFAVRNAARIVGSTLRVSRSTVYSLLAERRAMSA
ncbi:Predicted transcriptional regulator YheO, contains PAS and DNA-binding HTH domains [Streptomyces sp. TLI_053]|uniref:helix-turn-helix domain-containing protein n=1 Tax=Streptomyces sp. TLI_053 TaxID=1855352 RepID=UPI00087D5EAC|nr:helix-turn-helix domain-containing protein [Streptomyces sp. TLI_053]SDT77267.1 Predicted transcriptional regulator YheO, contains PAS and DNA-binding HTH domains [Streptomyces sp. TLI_053]